ncbi:hypothetical protein [Schlesneria paludicola]|uniref:hypothetical protein n=1 Tax=Schlesneria paludicola TaxID=360056 RepID=UPI00029B38BD|nr:hypothetical protein [Schlesneria paludicola]
MNSFLRELFSLMLGCLLGLPRLLVEELNRTLNGCREFLRVWLDDSQNSPQQTMAPTQSSVGPPGDWLTLVRSWLRPTPLARVRVPARRSIR